MFYSVYFALFSSCLIIFQTDATTIFPNTVLDVGPSGDAAGLLRIPSPFQEGLRRRCPICDSSVYSYCSDKLFHDSCCCNNPYNPYEQLPHQCKFADCSFLHANSCKEHKLITACCCTNLVNLVKKK